MCILGAQVDTLLGDRQPTLEDIKALYWTTRCLNEAMRLYPQPPVLIRRALEDDIVGGYKVRVCGEDPLTDLSAWPTAAALDLANIGSRQRNHGQFARG